MTRTAVVALGGNAISDPSGDPSIPHQFAQTRKSLVGIIELLHKGYRLAITHGNGPQVGEALLRMEHSLDLCPPRPLGILVADTQGGIGYMIEQSLQNGLRWQGLDRRVATLVTQVVVDQNDPELLKPSKFIGRAYSAAEAEALVRDHGWVLREDRGRGFRRVVGSPRPLAIVNRDAIRRLMDDGYIVICVGGGGIPVFVMANGFYEGVDAVVDKDRAAAVLARDVGAQDLFILTAVDRVALDFGTPQQTELDRLTISQAKQYLQEGQFPPGSMGPKIEAAVQFIESGGERALISSVERVIDAVHGETGTWIVRE
ncbi:MAG: carbamate kinase [Candidatus Zixiibacteriota bacterium]|nr:MAG: carbamate kinase [candidate division Zixibacteria bacterium]